MTPEKYSTQMRRFMVALNRIDGLYYQFAKSTHIKDTAVVLLYALSDGQPHTQKQICDEWLIPKTTLNTVVLDMQAQGQLQLLSEEGKKAKFIVLTESGKALAENILGKSFAAEKAALEKTLETCSPEFIEGFEQFAANFEQELKPYLRTE